MNRESSFQQFVFKKKNIFQKKMVFSPNGAGMLDYQKFVENLKINSVS